MDDSTMQISTNRTVQVAMNSILLLSITIHLINYGNHSHLS